MISTIPDQLHVCKLWLKETALVHITVLTLNVTVFNLLIVFFNQSHHQHLHLYLFTLVIASWFNLHSSFTATSEFL